MTADQQNYLERGTGETILEAGTGSVGILIEFAVANKVTAAARTAKLFTGGTKSLNQIMGGWKAQKYNNGRRILTEDQLIKRAGQLKMTPKAYRDFYKFKKVNNFTGNAQAILMESVIEGAKFAALPSSAGHRGDAFSTGFGFGFMGQALAPIFGQITETSVAKRFGKEGIEKHPVMARWMMKNASKLNMWYQLGLKGPTSFVTGSEMGELTKALTNDILGSHTAFSNYMEENWGDYSDPSKRLLSNWVVGTGFGLTHHIFPKKINGKYEWFSDYRSLSDMKNAKQEAFSKLYERDPYMTVISPKGKKMKMLPEDFHKLDNIEGWKQEGHGYKMKDGLTIEEVTRHQETMQIFDHMYQKAKGKHDLNNPILGQEILERMYKDATKFYRDRKIDVVIEWGNNKTMGDRRGSETYARNKDGSINKKKIKIKFNVDQISLGVMPHELGHAGMKTLFTENARFKTEFLETLGNIAKKIELEGLTLDGRQMTLYDKMVETNGKWDVHNRRWENDRIAEWELFSHVAEQLAKPENYAKLKESNAFGLFKNLFNNKLGKPLNHKYDLKVESEVVRFLGDYIQAVNKGSNHLGRGKGGLDHLSDVIDVSKKGETAHLRKLWEAELQSPEAPTTTLESNKKINELVKRNVALIKSSVKEGKWINKRDKKKYEDNLEEINKEKQFAEKPKIYKENRDNSEIVNENSRLVSVIEHFLQELGGTRVKHLPDGPIKDNIITNLRGNNIGVLPRIVKQTKAEAKEANVPKEEIPPDKELMGEAEIQMLQLIGNYNPKINPEFGAYIQSKDFGLMRKGGTILGKVRKGEVEGIKIGTEKLDTEGKFDYQKDFDLKNEYTETKDRLILRDRIFNTAKEKINTELRDEILKDIESSFNELAVKEILELNFTNIRDFHNKFSGEKPHKMFTALSKKNIDKIIRNSDPDGKLDKPSHIGRRWELLKDMMGENNVVEMSGVRAEKGVKGQEGRSIELRERLLNAKNSKGEELFERTGKRTVEDATGSSIEIREKIDYPLNAKGQKMFLDHFNIEVVEYQIPRPGEKGYDIGTKFQWKKGTTATEKLNADALLNEVYGRNFTAQQMVTWIKKNYRNNLELQQAMSEGQILGRLSGGAPKLFSENLNKLDLPNQIEFLNQLKTERFATKLNDNRKRYGNTEEAIIKTLKDHFEWIGDKHSISKAEIKEIGKDLYKEFQNAPNVKQKMLIQKAVKTIEFTNKLENITGRSKGKDGKPLSIYDVVAEWGTEAGILRTQDASRKVIKRLMKEMGVGVENTLATGEHGGAGVGVFRKTKIGQKITKLAWENMLTGTQKSGNRHAIFESAADFKKMIESIEVELLQEGLGKNADFKLKSIDVKQAESNRPGVKNKVFDAIVGKGDVWIQEGVNKLNESADLNMKVLKRSSEILRDLYKEGEIDHNQARSWVEMHFAGMRSLGKKSAGLALIPNMSPVQMKKIWGKNATDYVLEHLTPAQYVKARMYDYILNGKAKKTALELTLRDYHTTILPKKLDNMVNELAKTDMPSNHLPGMDPMMRYYEMFHSSDFNFGFKNVMFGKNNLQKIYDHHPNLSVKEKLIRQAELGKQYREILKKLNLDQGITTLNSKNLNHLNSIEKAIAEGRKAFNKKRRGISVWDFDDTIALTKSGVRYTLPNPSGTPAPRRKVIFMAGGPGSGKSNVIKQLGLKKQGFKVVNQDISLEWLAKNHGLPKDMRDFTPEQASKWGELTWDARMIAKEKQMKYQGKGDGVIVDGTGNSLKSMQNLVAEFKNKGYDVQMLFVETSKDIAVARNKARAERSLKTSIVERTWENVANNKQAFKEMFGKRFAEVNTNFLKQGDPMPPELILKLDKFTKGYIKERLNAGEFAEKGQELKEQGAEFDFTEFDFVKEGTKGPFFSKAQNRIKKFGNEHQYILTARPPAAQKAIYWWLEAQGLKIPFDNITALGNSTAEAKALWMLKKAAEGYNDFYFADDAVQNIREVKSVLKQLDVKSKVVQAKVQKEKSLNEVKDVEKLDSPDTFNNILYSKNLRLEYEKTIAKNRPDLVKEGLVSKSVDDMFNFIKSLDVPVNKRKKYQTITTKWLATSSIKLKEDGYKVKDAIELAEKYKEDIFSYRNPNEIIEKYAGKAKEKPINPKIVKEFSKGKIVNKKHGIVEYEVENTKEGQQAVRNIVDTHFGKDSNPWCITQTRDGKLTTDSWINWRGYETGPKSIVFQNGKLIGFKANEQYWDRMDNATDAPVVRIKDGRVTKTVELVPIGKGKVQEFVMETRTVSKDKKTVTTEIIAETMDGYAAGTKIIENRVKGIAIKRTYYNPKGQKVSEYNFDKKGKAVSNKTLNPEGKIRGINAYGMPFGGIGVERIVKEKGDILSHEITEGKENYWHGHVNIRGEVVEIGWKMPENVSLESVVKTSPEGKIRLDLKKVLEIDAEVKGLSKEARAEIERVFAEIKVPTTTLRNLKPVKNVLNQLDVKSKVQQATKLNSENLSKDFNKILEETKDIAAKKMFSEAKGKIVGKRKWNIPLIRSWGAEDFMGLTTYAFSGKGKQGEAHQEFFRTHLEKPFSDAYNSIHGRKQAISNDYKALRKEFKDVTKMLNKTVDGVFTVDQAIRVYNWNKSGFKIPGLSKADLKTMVDFVNHADSGPVKAFAENLRVITRLKEGYIKPKEYWLGENITMDMNNVVDRIYRKEALSKFIENREQIFGKWENGKLVGSNMNKIEAAYGPKHREALENMLWRMENGTNRSVGKDSNVNRWMNWVNNATGTIMFFNQKSATLQTISTLNYVNGTFNNPLRAAQAFANQPQYWKDFAKIFNSDMMIQRRAGLKINIEANELMERVGSGNNAPQRALAYLLQKGFIPTKYADSFAIASGGATYYRNSIRKYKKQGLSEKEAETRAWEDLVMMTEATQQSSRPDLISMQQASALGRPILAFANTPIQMFRRHKRRIQDIANRRGNTAENIASALYYGFAQTLVFSFLQNAMFAVDDESEDPKDIKHAEKQKSRYVNTIADSYLRGMGTGGAGVSALKNGLFRFLEESKKDYNADYGNVVVDMLNVSPPIGSKARKIYSAGKTWKWNKDVIKEMGLDIDNPGILASANVISALTNIPIDRAVMKVKNIRDASSSDFATWERIAMLMGWNKWNLGIGEKGLDEIRIKRVEDRLTKEKQLERKLEKYNVETEEEVIRIDKGKEIKALNKNQQIKILKDLGYSDYQIKNMKKEEDRVNKILLKYDKDNKRINKLIIKYPKDDKTSEKSKELKLSDLSF